MNIQLHNASRIVLREPFNVRNNPDRPFDMVCVEVTYDQYGKTRKQEIKIFSAPGERFHPFYDGEDRGYEIRPIWSGGEAEPILATPNVLFAKRTIRSGDRATTWYAKIDRASGTVLVETSDQAEAKRVAESIIAKRVNDVAAIAFVWNTPDGEAPRDEEAAERVFFLQEHETGAYLRYKTLNAEILPAFERYPTGPPDDAWKTFKRTGGEEYVSAANAPGAIVEAAFRAVGGEVWNRDFFSA